jgi:hypothetical protein
MKNRPYNYIYFALKACVWTGAKRNSYTKCIVRASLPTKNVSVKIFFSYESYFLQTNKLSRVITFHTKAQNSVYIKSSTISISVIVGTVSGIFPPVYVFV